MSSPSPIRQEANEALKKFLLPRLREFGFKGSGQHFRRTREDRIDLITIQFDKWGGAFCINIAICAPTGVRLSWGPQVAPNKVTAFDVNPGPRTRLTLRDDQSDCWFRYDNGPGPREFTGTPEECAKAAGAAIASRAEDFFTTAPHWWQTPGAG